jgi:hypothetical protein
MTTYTKQTWTNDDPTTPLNGTRLGYMEDGIQTAQGTAAVAFSGLGPLRNRNLCAVGDSITDYDRDVSGEPRATFNDWPSRLATISNGALILQANVAVGGRQTSHILAGFDTELAGTDPAVILDLSGTNDARAAKTLASFITNKLAILDKIRDKGAMPVWATIPPSGVVAIPAPAAPVLTTATTGGTLAPGTYSYRVTATRPTGESLPSPAATIVVPAGTSTNVVNVQCDLQLGANGYKIYGRTSGSELRLSSSTISTSWNGQTSARLYQDTGSATPGAAVPTVDATGIVSDATAQPLLEQYNAWMRKYAAENGILLIPFHEQVVDLTTGRYLAAASMDGIHPSPTYADLLARTALPLLSSRSLGAISRTPSSVVDSTNKAPNPMHATSLSGWTQLSTTISTWTRETRTGFKGFAGHYTATSAPFPNTNSAGIQHSSGASNTNWTTGDTLEVAMKLEIAANSGAQVIVNLINATGGSVIARWLFNGVNLAPSELVKRIPAPSGNLLVSVRIWYGTAEFYIGESAVRNLTQLGLV